MNSKPLLMFILLLLGCFPQIASDIYAPALSVIASDMMVHVNLVQMSMAVFMFGFAFSQLIYGPISEGFGRRPIMLVGLLIALVGTVICLMAPNIDVLIAGRLVQGLGAGSSTLFRSIMRDSFEGDEMSKYGSYLMIFVTFAIPAAPIVGAYISEHLGWRHIFTFLIIYAIAAIFICYFLFVETSKHHHRDRLKFSFVFETYKHLITNKLFLGYTLAVLLTYGAFFSWMIVLPVLFVKELGLSQITFGWVMFVGTGSMMALMIKKVNI